MKTITVHACQEYPVHIEADLLSTLEGLPCCKVLAIISDSNVWKLYGSSLDHRLKAMGYEVVSYVISPGESSKNTENYLNILNFLAENSLHRQDCVLALGGGVVGDLAGFSAACYLRGIPYIQLPTTLLAMVDSSVGGKTAINLPAGKNLAGAFYQPKAVYCDIHVLDSLPKQEFLDGCAEVIKYAILYDEALFSHLQAYGPDFHRETVIAQCIDWKARVVAEDEFDQGSRMLLNLGHTIGHAIEKESHYSITHGQSVASGIGIATRIAEKMGLCHQAEQILSLLIRFGLPVSTVFSAEALLSHMRLDKKNQDSDITLILPRRIGCCEIHRIPEDSLLPLLESCLR